MGPMLLIDKSLVNGLGRSHIPLLHRSYHVVISPTLIREILGDLVKEDGDKDPQETVSLLAGRTTDGSAFVLSDYRKMAFASLTGGEVPLTGQIPSFEAVPVRNKRGELGYILEQPKEIGLLRKWKSKQFSAQEFETAQYIRNAGTFDFSTLKKNCKEILKSRPGFQSLDKLVEWVDSDFIGTMTKQEKFINAVNLLGLLPHQKKRIFEAWNRKSCPPLDVYSPYVNFIQRAVSIYNFGIASEKLPSGKSAKSHVDLEYILYLPFCMAFASGDRFHQKISPFLMRPDQTFLYKDDVQKDLKIIDSLSDGDDPREKLAEFDASLTLTSWLEHLDGIGRASQKNSSRESSADELSISEIMGMMDNSYVVSDGKRYKESKFHQSIKELDLEQRNHILLDLVEHELGIKQGLSFKERRETFGAENVKRFYSSYADIWPPDTDYLSMLRQPSGKNRACVHIDFSTEPVSRVIPFLPIYFDSFLMVDPALHPWSMKPEMNPIVSPGKFIIDTYEYLNSVIFVMPQILMKRLSFVPDPSNFNPAVREDLIGRAKKRVKSSTPSARDLETFQRKSRRMIADWLACLPEGRFKEQIKMYDPSLSEMQIIDCMNYFREERRKDPRHLPNFDLSKEGSIQFWRTGGNLEQMMLVSELTSSVPIFESDMRLAEICEISNPQSEFHDSLTFDVPLFISNDPFLAEIIRDLEPFSEMRKLINDLLKWRQKPVGKIPDELSKDLVGCAKALEKHLDEIGKAIHLAFSEDNHKMEENFFVDSHAILKFHVRTLNEIGMTIKRQNSELIGTPNSNANIIVFAEVILRAGFVYRDFV